MAAEVAEAAIHLPLWKVLELEPAYLRHEIEKLAREFGYVQIIRQAARYGPAEVTVEFRIRQPFETDEP